MPLFDAESVRDTDVNVLTTKYSGLTHALLKGLIYFNFE